MEPKDTAERIEHGEARIAGGPGDRFSGYAVMGLPFRSGHVLALRRFPATSIGPEITSVWHRSPGGLWTFYSTGDAEQSCGRYWSRALERHIVTPIEIRWRPDGSLRIVAGEYVDWTMTFESTIATRVMSAVAKRIPPSFMRRAGFVRLMGRIAGVVLRAGRMQLGGITANGYRFTSGARQMWMIPSSRAVVQGKDIGPIGPLATQATLGTFLIPQRGLLAVGDVRMIAPEEKAVLSPAMRTA